MHLPPLPPGTAEQDSMIVSRDIMPLTLAWLPPKLQILQLKNVITLVWEGCACVPGLKKLDLSVFGLAVPKQLSLFFPNLEVVLVDTRQHGFPTMKAMFEDLGSNFLHLKNVGIWCANVLPDFEGPSGCRVMARLEVEERDGPVEIEVPRGLASQLCSIEIDLQSPLDTATVNPELDLAIFAECHVLSCIVLNLGGFNGTFGLRVSRFESLPASCKVVEFRECHDEYPSVNLAKGWQREEMPQSMRMCRVDRKPKV